MYTFICSCVYTHACMLTHIHESMHACTHTSIRRESVLWRFNCIKCYLSTRCFFLNNFCFIQKGCIVIIDNYLIYVNWSVICACVYIHVHIYFNFNVLFCSMITSLYICSNRESFHALCLMSYLGCWVSYAPCSHFSCLRPSTNLCLTAYLPLSGSRVARRNTNYSRQPTQDEIVSLVTGTPTPRSCHISKTGSSCLLSRSEMLAQNIL